MTPEEKRAQMIARDKAICDFYLEGHKISQCASRFGLTRQRIIQILRDAGVWKPYEKNGPENFLGVLIDDADKQALRELAKERGVSMSSLSAEAIHEMLATVKQRTA